MTGKQRFLAAILHKNTDRCSVHPAIDMCYAAARTGFSAGECFMRPDLHAAALSALFEIHPDIDGLYVNLCLSPEALTDIRDDGDTYYAKDTAGITWVTPENDVGTAKSHAVTNLEDDRIATENPLKDGILRTYEYISQTVKDEYMIVPGLTGSFSQLVFILGLEQVLMLMYDEPEALEKALEKRTRLALDWAEGFVRLGCECVWIGEGAASSSIISPAMYTRFVLPYARRVVVRLEESGIRSIMHVCGDINKSAHIIKETGANAMDIDYIVDMPSVRLSVGNTVCLKGNLNPMELLIKKPDEIKALCGELIRSTTQPFILSTGCLVARDTPYENVDAMVDASKCYPI